MRNLIRETNAGTKGWGWGAAAGNDTAKVEKIDYQGALGVKLTRLARPGSWNYVQKGSVLLNGLKSATDYILSMDIKQSNPNAFQVSIRQGDSLNPWTTTVTVPKVGTTDWVHMDLPMRTLDEFPKSNGQVLYMRGFITAPDTEVCVANLALYEGTIPQPWCPAPEDVTNIGFSRDDFENATVEGGKAAGSSWEDLYSSYATRIRTKKLVPLSDHFGMFTHPDYHVCLCEFGPNGYLGQSAGFMNWSNGWVYRKLNSQTTHIGICFRKADSSAITPAEVTSVSGGGY